jgi:antitoxin VapB
MALVSELAKRIGMTHTGAIEDAVRSKSVELDKKTAGRHAHARQLLDGLRRSLTEAERTALRCAQENLYNDTGLPA